MSQEDEELSVSQGQKGVWDTQGRLYKKVLMAETGANHKRYVQQLQKELEKFQQAPKYSLDSEEVFCTCRRPDNGELMVACDGCDEWFHFKCMGLDKRNKDLVRNFYCKFCDVLQRKGKSVWKKKCKVAACYKPIDGESQFCSTEHGEQYWREFLDRFGASAGTGAPLGIEHNSTELLSRQQAENLIQLLSTREELLAVGNTLPVFDKGPLQSTPSQETEMAANRAAVGALSEESENLKFKLGYLLKLKDILVHLNELLTVSMDPENQAMLDTDGTLGEGEEVAKLGEKKKKKSRTSKKVKKFRIDICGFDQRILNDEKTWAEFKNSSECEDMMRFENFTPEEKRLITEHYEALKGPAASTASCGSTILAKICTADKRKCHLHNGWYSMIKDGLELKIGENSAEVDKKVRDNEKLEKFIQIKNWKLYCNEE